MSQIAVDLGACLQDGACVAVCPSGVLAFGAEGVPAEVPDRSCILCGHCVAVCPNGAIRHAGLPEDESLPAVTGWPSPQTMDGLLTSRRSVREFGTQPVARAILRAVLEVARRAPTASNSQCLRWIVVEGREKVRSIAREIVEFERVSGRNASLVSRWDTGEDAVLRGAPAVAVVCAPEEYRWGKEDGAIALTYLELAAEARGIGVCWAGYLTRVAQESAALRTRLGVPAGHTVRGGLMLGHGTHAYARVPPRKPLTVQWL
jgi:nitroreductase/NAD-dependent dihydropyrimidine dehydrogenase PreA subunit